MDLEDVERLLAKIREASNAADDEVAHGLQDELYEKVLGAIAHRDCADPVALADAALGVKAIDFARWYA
jgi:hypothetical protein